MKKTLRIVIFLLMLSLCACGSKPQPTPTASPTSVPTEIPTEAPAAVPTEIPAEEEPEKITAPGAGSEAENEEDTFDPSDPESVLDYYSARGEEMYGSYAYVQLDTEGKRTWSAPLAGIKEFKVPESFPNAKGGIRAGGGEELFIGTGIVSMDVFYLPYTEAKYKDFLEKISAFAAKEDPTEEDIQNYADMVRDYDNNAYHLFGIMGIGDNRTLEDLKNGLRVNFMKVGLTSEDVDDLFSVAEFKEAGSAEDYNFYLIKHGKSSAFFTEEQAEYRNEYDDLYDAADTYLANFTFMRPLALAQMVSEGTRLEFETKDLNGDPVSSRDLFGSHKATMLNIWETTCSSCMSEMPELKKLADMFEAKGGQIVGLVYDASDDDLIEEAKEIAADLDLNFVNLLPTQEMIDFFKAQAFPTTYFFNEKGEVIGEPIVGANTERYAVIMNGFLGE